jgi:hypothetical protein
MNVYIITSAKYEECYIEEWVRYHLNMGFDKIIINDNNPKNYPYNPKDILQKYIDDNKVIIERYYDTHEIPSNLDAPDADIPNIYTWLYTKYKDEFDWIAKLDIDEYLEIPETNNDIKKFLLQNKFNNALSIIIPFKRFAIKPEYSYLYEKTNSIKDKYNIFDCHEFWTWDFKSIIKKSEYISIIHLHYAYFSIDLNNDKNLILYMAPDGSLMQQYLFNDVPNYNQNVKDVNFIENTLYNICFINHYNIKSIEERVNHCIKFDTNQYPNWHLYKNQYISLYKDHQSLFENPRDLYKIYFMNND